MLSVSFGNRHFSSTTQNKKNQQFAHKLKHDFRNCTVIVDKEMWERIYLFFFGGRKENRLQRFMEQNLENTLQTALSEYVKFRIEVTNPMVILPQFATTRDHLISLLKSHAFRLGASSLLRKQPISSLRCFFYVHMRCHNVVNSLS